MVELYDYMVLHIGDAADLSTEALDRLMPGVLVMLLATPATTAIDITISGYDDDPRELWEIPESRRFILEFAERILNNGIRLERFLPETVNLIAACHYTHRGKNVHRVDPTETIEQQIKAHQERAKRKMT